MLFVVAFSAGSLAFTNSTTEDSGAAGVGAPSTSSSSTVLTRRVAAPECPSARKAVHFYALRLNAHRTRVGAPAVRRISPQRGCPRYLAQVLKRKARAWRLRAEDHVESLRTLRDYRFCDGCRAWHKAVAEVQRVFPGTESWLLSCSAAEGGHGRWVGYSGVSYSTWLRDSDTVGGPLQFRFSTFKGMWRRGSDHAVGRGFIVPRMDDTTAWRSALGQAIAGGWARYTGNDNSHWSASWGRGC